MKYVRLATVVSMLLASACASTPPPHEKVGSSEAAIRAAEELGANSDQRASLHLQLARDELEQGRASMRKGNNHDAAAALLRSQADAELAFAMAREARTRAAAEAAIAKVQSLTGETGTAIGGGPALSTPPPGQPSTSPSATPAAPTTWPPSSPSSGAPAPSHPPNPNGATPDTSSGQEKAPNQPTR
jgi:hypothetical protein